MSTTHNHTDDIAHAMYTHIASEDIAAGDRPSWDILVRAYPEQAAKWRDLAANALPIIGQHAAADIIAWGKDHTASLPAWLRWIVYAILGGLSTLGVSQIAGCTSAQQADASALHRLYHELTGTECALPTTNPATK